MCRFLETLNYTQISMENAYNFMIKLIFWFIIIFELKKIDSSPLSIETNIAIVGMSKTSSCTHKSPMFSI